ncbi:MAG TPA: hypothetical protein VHS34_01480 [Terriglobales bacterium]|jgi:hypothetical protein|nr:hypothetical protein [Terriglobales bacterium]
MNQPLRSVHRRTFVALTFVLPAILWIALGARRPRSGSDTAAARIPESANVVREWSASWQKHSIQSTFYRKVDRPPELYVVLQPVQRSNEPGWNEPELNEPDLLLYWAADAPQGNVLPAEAQLMGAFTTGKAFLLPLNQKSAGHLILFSLAQQGVFDAAAVEQLP